MSLTIPCRHAPAARIALAAALARLVTVAATAQDPVLSEIMYNPPGDDDAGEYIEIWNPGGETVDLGGWKLSGAVTLELPAGARLEKDARAVLVRSLDGFRAVYGDEVTPLAVYQGGLNNDGEEMQLADRSGRVVDVAAFATGGRWPQGPAGHGSALERISPVRPAQDAACWAPSPVPALPGDRSGTPGRPNITSAPHLPPVIAGLRWSPQSPLAHEDIKVTVMVQHRQPIEHAEIVYRVARPAEESAELRIHLQPEGPRGRIFSGTIPGQDALCLVRFRLVVRDAQGVERAEPSPHDLRPFHSVFVRPKDEPGVVPRAFLFHVDAGDAHSAREALLRSSPGGGPRRQAALARSDLERKLALDGVWGHFFADEKRSLQDLSRVRTLLAAEAELRRQAVDAAMAAADFDDKVQTGHADVIAAADARLRRSLAKAFSAAEAAPAIAIRRMTAAGRGTGFGIEPTVRAMFRLDSVAHFVAFHTDVDLEGLEEFRRAFLPVRAEETRFVEEIKAKVAAGEPPFAALFAGAGDLRGKAIEGARAILSRGDRVHLQRWAARARQEMRDTGPHQGPSEEEGPSRGSAALCTVDASGRVEAHDFVHAPPRPGGFKVKLHRDRPLRFEDAFAGATSELGTVNLLFEHNPRFPLAEALAYEVYRRCGVPSPVAGHVRLWVDGFEQGYYLVVEQPNRAFLRRNQRNDDGNLYKVLWYGQGVVEQHEKKAGRGRGHEDLLDLLKLLDSAQGEDQWKIIEQRFHVDEVVSYFAASLCLSNWDGLFNNHFAYHDVKGTGKWELYPWDEDKTWGYHDGLGRGQIFHDMPLDYGADGAAPPGGAPQGGPGQRGQFRGVSARTPWWRPPGYFSGPLLANAVVRARYHRRAGEILRTIYTEEAMLPLIEGLEKRLEPEVIRRADVLELDREAELNGFREDLASLRKHLVERRKFLLGLKELAGSGS